jgi:UDP-GlcNAc:undecaprenyl-phosphate GlcNAc-1-phosphate transferase
MRLAWATGYLDHPEARKLHTAATALLGGAAVFAAALAGWLASGWVDRSTIDRPGVVLLSGAFLALLLGLWDDRAGMRPAVKLIGQAAAGGTLIASGLVPDFGLPAAVTVPLVLLVIIAVMNAVNFLDNMNGMVGGLGAITFAGFGLHSAWRGATGTAAAQLALAGACAGFLRYNFPRARIFLGDAGSLFLGYSLGASAVLACRGPTHGWGWLGAALMLGYPAFDLTFVVINRLMDGRKIYIGGKDHTNHRLASVLKCPKTTVMILWLNGAALCASGIVVLNLDRPTPALLLSALWMLLFLWAGTRLSRIPVSAPSAAPT